MLKHICSLLMFLMLCNLPSALAAQPPTPPKFTIPAKQRIVIYVADG